MLPNGWIACTCDPEGPIDACCQVVLHVVGELWVPRKAGDCPPCPGGGGPCQLWWNEPRTQVQAICPQ